MTDNEKTARNIKIIEDLQALLFGNPDDSQAMADFIEGLGPDDWRPLLLFILTKIRIETHQTTQRMNAAKEQSRRKIS